jgi:hypothetical protein
MVRRTWMPVGAVIVRVTPGGRHFAEHLQFLLGVQGAGMGQIHFGEGRKFVAQG